MSQKFRQGSVTINPHSVTVTESSVDAEYDVFVPQFGEASLVAEVGFNVVGQTSNSPMYYQRVKELVLEPTVTQRVTFEGPTASPASGEVLLTAWVVPREHFGIVQDQRTMQVGNTIGEGSDDGALVGDFTARDIALSAAVAGAGWYAYNNYVK